MSIIHGDHRIRDRKGHFTASWCQPISCQYICQYQTNSCQYLNQYHPIIKCEMPISCQYICQYQPIIKCEMQNYETKKLIYLKFWNWEKNVGEVRLFIIQQIGQATNGPRPFHPSQGNEFLDSRLNDRGQPPPGRNTGKQRYEVILITVIRSAYAHSCELYWNRTL